MISYILPRRSATIQQLGHPSAGVIGWQRGTVNTSGVIVTEDTARTYAAVWCAIRIISETVASLPCMLYRRTSDGKERARDDQRFGLVHDQPNDEQSAFTYFETGTHHLVLYGNSYGVILEDGAGRVGAIEPRLPDRVRIERDPMFNRLVYKIDDVGETWSADEMLHVPSLGNDGLVGQSVIQLAAQSIGTGIAAEKYAGAYFGNGARPDGALIHAQKLDKPAREAFRKDWDELHKGSENANKVAILHGGLDYKQLGMSNVDSQFLESRKFSISEIARWFRLPNHMLGDLEKSTFANIEQQSLEFVVYSLTPWLRRWETTLNRKLLMPDERQEMFFEFLLLSLLRGDQQSRKDYYAAARQWGWLSANDIRELENLNRVQGGDVYLQPLNMGPAGQAEELEQAMSANVTAAVNEIRQSAQQLRDAIQSHAGQSVREVVDRAVAEIGTRSEQALAGLRADRETIKTEMVTDSRVQVMGVDLLRDVACQMIASKLETATAVILKRARRAANRQVHNAESFLGWLERASCEFGENLCQVLSRPVNAYILSIGTPEDIGTLEHIAREHADFVSSEILAASDGDPSEFVARVSDVGSEWDYDQLARGYLI